MKCMTTDGVHFFPMGKTRIHFKNLPFSPEFNQIIFYDPITDSSTSKYIEEHLQEIQTIFFNRGFKFCYFPALIESLKDLKIVKYFFPHVNEDWLPNTNLNSNCLQAFLEEEDKNIDACFLRCLDSFGVEFSRYKLQDLSLLSIWEQLDFYIHRLPPVEYGSRNRNRYAPKNEEHIMFSIGSSEPPEWLKLQRQLEELIEQQEYADIHFDEESKKLMIEVKDKINRLRQKGISDFILKSLVNDEDKLSRIIISGNNEILLPDYNMQIEMSPLPKTVFFLFLKYENGIYFKDLPDYKQKLCQIYRQISNRIDISMQEKSIMDITDPTKNAINEKCSRIREAFVSQFDERLAKNYFITGKRGERKRIILPRNLVEWQIDI